MCHWTQQAKLCKTASPKIFLHLTNTKSEELSLINEPEVACDNNLMLFWLPACLGISYPTAKHFTFKPHAPSAPPPKKIGALHCFCGRSSAPGAERKVKVAHARLPSVGFPSWSRFLAVSLQVTWVINRAVGCHYFPAGLQLPSQPLRGLLPVSLLDEQRHDRCEQFA